MKGEDILNAMSDLDEKLVKKNSGEAPRRKRIWPALTAACLLLAIGLGLMAGGFEQQGPVCYMPTLRQDGEVEGGGQYSLIGHHTMYEAGFVVTARAIERMEGVYETPARYGSMTVERLCIYKMQVLESLDEAVPEVFYYAIPEKYDEDLTKYDTLLISMFQQGVDYQLIHTETGRLDTFDNLFYESWPFYGDIIAFRDGVFDISLWKCENWISAPFSVYRFMTTHGISDLLVKDGITLEEVVEKILQRRQSEHYTPAVYHTNELTGDAAQALQYVRSCAPGTYVGSGRYGFLSNYGAKRVFYTRYVNGYPTNSYIAIDRETNTVEYSPATITAADLENLPDLGAYIRDLDLDALSPPNKDVEGRELIHRVVYGWYEKTENGLYAMVKIAWAYQGDKSYRICDDMYIHLTNAGPQVLTEEEVEDLIGDSAMLDVHPNSWYIFI